MAWESAITRAGAALLTQWAGGGTLTVEAAKLGTGFVNGDELANQTRLVQERRAASIVDKKMTDGAMQIKLQVQAQEEALVVNQIGIFAKLDEGESTLIAIYQNKEGVAVPASSEMAEFAYDFYALIKVSNDGKIVVNYDPNAFLTNETLLEVEKRLEEITATAETKMREILERAAMPVYNVTVPTDGWNLGEDGKQHITVEAEDVRATDTPVADVDLSTGSLAENLAILKAFALIMDIDTGDGNVTFTAAAVPDVELPLRLKEVR